MTNQPSQGLPSGFLGCRSHQRSVGSKQIPVTLGLQLFAPSPNSLFISIPLKAWFSSASIYFGIPLSIFGIPSRLNLGWGWDALDYQWLHPFLSIFDAHIPVFDGSNSQIVDYSTSTCLLLKSTITFDGQVQLLTVKFKPLTIEPPCFLIIDDIYIYIYICIYIHIHIHTYTSNNINQNTVPKTSPCAKLRCSGRGDLGAAREAVPSVVPRSTGPDDP